MRLAIIICILCIRCVICDNYEEPDEDTRDLNTERKLHRDLLSNYDVFEAPNKTTTVSVRFILKYFNFDANEEIFTMYSWLFLVWFDDRLKWDPKNYAGIYETQFTIYQIWMPELKHHTNILYDDFDQVLNAMCQSSSNGRMFCALQVLSHTECNTDLVHWPYDIQKCTFKFGVNTLHKDNSVFTFNSSRGISMFGAEYGPGWNIIDFEKGENATSDTQFYLTFVLERQADSLASITIFSSTVLSILTVSSLFLDVGNTRGGIATLSLLGHFYIQSFISFTIPLSSSTAPSILHLIITSIAMTTVSILLTVVLSILLKRKDPPQQWIVTVNEFVYKSSMRFLIWPRWEAKKMESAANETKGAGEVWMDFANIINSTSILIMIVVYISMFSTFIPKQIPIDYNSL